MDKILILKGFRVGDAICQTPAVALLKKIKPSATIDMIAQSQVVVDIFKDNPHIRQIFLCPNSEEVKAMNANYDYAFAFEQDYYLEDYLPLLTIPVYKPKDFHTQHLAETIPNFFFEHYALSPIDYDKHYQLFPKNEDNQQTLALLQKAGITAPSQTILIGMHIGCYKLAERAQSWFRWKVKSHRNWPFKNFKLLAEKLWAENPDIKIILTGTKGEERVAKKIFKKDPRVINLINQTSVLTLTALMKHLKLFITSDTGPMHVAVAMQTPLIALFGSTDPEKSGPYPKESHHIVLYRKNMDEITVEEVFEAAKLKISAITKNAPLF